MGRGSLCPFSSLSSSLCLVCSLSPQAPCLLWSISTPSSHWPCPANWSFQAEVGNAPSCCLPRMEPGQRQYREPLPVFFLRRNQLPINYQIILKSTLAVKKNITLNSQNRPYSQNEDSHTRIISGYMRELLVSGGHFCSSSLTH